MGTAIIRLRSAHRGRTATSSAASGSIQRESLDHLVVFDEAQLRRVLRNYAPHFNKVRTHLSLDKNAPYSRFDVAELLGVLVLTGNTPPFKTM
jgi:hypothetical protein